MFYLKIFLLVAALFIHGIIAAIGKIIFIFNNRLCILYIANINKIFFILLGFIIGIHVRKSGKQKYYKNPVLYVGNHLSYLDVLVIGQCYPTIFITSIDMGERKSEGWLTSNAGSIYVERRKEKLTLNILKKNIDDIKKTILKGCPLCIFPEATSANGGKELIFFSSLFSSVEFTETTIVPFAIIYTEIDGEQLSKKNESIIYFYKGQHFVPHIKRLLYYKNIKVKINFLNSFSAKNKNRKQICNHCKEIIMEGINARVPNFA
jgi:1-acyl-sn-glycerol-3-phosphate acyltransferase